MMMMIMIGYYDAFEYKLTCSPTFEPGPLFIYAYRPSPDRFRKVPII